MDPSLRSRLERLNAELSDFEIEPSRAVWLACDFLIAGLDTPALRELAGESPTRLGESEARDLVRQILEELGITPMTSDEAQWFLGRETARQVLAGAPRAEWERGTWRVTVPLTGENDDVFAALANYDDDPGPFLDFTREYLRLADEALGTAAPQA